MSNTDPNDSQTAHVGKRPPSDPTIPPTTVLPNIPLVERAEGDDAGAPPRPDAPEKQFRRTTQQAEIPPAELPPGTRQTAAGPLDGLPLALTQTPAGAGGVNAIGFGGPLPSPAGPGTSAPLPNQATPRLVVLRGERVDASYRIYEGPNFIGRTDEKPVDIDLEEQEAPDRIWTSRQHACITYTNGVLTVEDLNSLNGTFVNRMKVHPGQHRVLQVNDVVQIGTVQLKVVLG